MTRDPNNSRSSDDVDSSDTAVENSSRPSRESGTGVRSCKHVALPGASLLLAFLVFLFGTDVVSRFRQPERPSDAQSAKHQPTIGEQRFHARYSFKKAPFVHPKIVNDLIGSLSDTGDQVVAINLIDSQDSNRYFGEIFVAPQTNPQVPSWPWVYSLSREPNKEGELEDLWGQEFSAYRYLGSTRSGLDVLHANYSGGGSGIFNRVVFIRTEADYGVEYPLLRDIDSRRGATQPGFRNREIIRIVGKILLGDRWHGTVEVVGDDVVVRGRDLYERCKLGGVSIVEAVEMRHFMDIDCKDGEADYPPPARVYKAPLQR